MKISTPLLSAGLLAVCVAALATALVAEHGFGLRPCNLCLIQRVPFVLAALLAAAAWLRPGAAVWLLRLAGVVLLINGGIAVYHVGVEQHWWVSAVCPATAGGGPVSVANLLEEMNRPVEVSCDTPAWSFMGITMAALNVPFSALLGLFVLISTRGSRP
ncbi:disulfide bond formation protein B [Magnetospirillum sp. SS-4]|uniref:disulfide bond formation protein B n=1 Tax=Magnetospirillum sp. SS-4 TaxID=2681465 RepID=UPI0013864DE8|nr:disulfide bond formation protein B [Magnetospirillum sp. SS-4]CAA7623472.1 Disulfide bond formation protein DsbB [Magnetospirillum sp. SS-4]